ncbi:FxsB family cyclophane-forming radical SAM/SPASM peptide maturase [Kitasatospora sp. NPDC091335]|uniref:FxsB family cyclophane-forming radical SAM/SPASM peptide maturase n=1 Tax=Kitasatospora sp. NPDC091335 TaxID=3364085 RepID=UPI003829E612
MVAFRQFLLKIHSRCNLACDYCYVYQGADQSWRGRPRRMELATVRRTARRIDEHAAEHGLDEVSVVLHGGEPLLVGAAHLDALLGELAAVGPRVRFTVQTNGLRLADEPELLDVLHRHRVAVGVSLDGTRADHDRHRLLPSGGGSWARTAEAVRLLGSDRHRELFAGLLCVVDLAADPVATYEALLEFAPPRIDLLLPHATWREPPPGLMPGLMPRTVPHAPPSGSAPAPYGEWLIAAFDRWYGAPRRETGVRLFEELAVLLLGGRAASEAVGLAPVDLVVVEADGTIEQADSLKVAYDGAPGTGLDVWRHGFGEAAAHPAFRARQRGLAGLGPVCAGCPLARVCGGGLYAHRYAGDGFGHPSVYCADLDRLIRHIAGRLRSGVTGLAGAGRAGAGS